jgi:hypothetical protein
VGQAVSDREQSKNRETGGSRSCSPWPSFKPERDGSTRGAEGNGDGRKPEESVACVELRGRRNRLRGLARGEISDGGAMCPILWPDKRERDEGLESMLTKGSREDELCRWRERGRRRGKPESWRTSATVRTGRRTKGGASLPLVPLLGQWKHEHGLEREIAITPVSIGTGRGSSPG